jgi:hypothetical protein
MTYVDDKGNFMDTFLVFEAWHATAMDTAAHRGSVYKGIQLGLLK